MKFAKIENGIVVQIQPNEEPGFIQVDDNIIAGMIQNSDQTFSTPLKSIESIASSKKDEIRNKYIEASNSSVTVSGVVYQGGFDSAIKLDAAMRLADSAGLSNVTFYDSKNDDHELTITDALTVVIQVSSAFQTQLAKKQSYFKQVDMIANDTSLTDDNKRTQINAIAWN